MLECNNDKSSQSQNVGTGVKSVSQPAEVYHSGAPQKSKRIVGRGNRGASSPVLQINLTPPLSAFRGGLGGKNPAK